MIQKLFNSRERKNLKRIVGFSKRVKSFVLLVIAAVFFVSLFELVTPLATKYIIDDVYALKNQALLNKVVMGIIILNIFSVIITFIKEFFDIYLNKKINFQIRFFLYKYMQKFKLRFFEQNQTGSIVHRIMNDVDEVSILLVYILISPLISLFSFITTFGVALLINWKLALILLLLIPVSLYNTYFFTQKMQAAAKIRGEKTGECMGFLYETYAGIKSVKAFNLQFNKSIHFFNLLKSLFSSTSNLEIIAAITRIFNSLILYCGWIFIIWYGGTNLNRGTMSIGSILVFLSLYKNIYNPFESLMWIYQEIKSRIPAVDRICAVLDNLDDTEVHGSIKKETIEGKISFRNVSFSYNAEKTVLDNITLTMHPGKTYALVGPSGSGKSTIINVIPRFYDIEKGEILIDDCSVKNMDLYSLRHHIGVVLQQPYIFSGTVMENLTFGDGSITMEQVITACKQAEIYKRISQFKEGFNTVIGERGVSLSGGEQQRLTIARVILMNPKILIFDEATSNVDAESEDLIQKSLHQISKGRTTILIAHRLSTVTHADKIFVIHKGKIKEEGKHHQLMAEKGLYHKLVSLQTGET